MAKQNVSKLVGFWWLFTDTMSFRRSLVPWPPAGAHRLAYLIISICSFRYLGLFGDHIVPAVLLYRYTQVLWRPDLINSQGKPLVTTAKIEAVWKMLADRLATVVTDTSMIPMSIVRCIRILS